MLAHRTSSAFSSILSLCEFLSNISYGNAPIASILYQIIGKVMINKYTNYFSNGGPYLNLFLKISKIEILKILIL